jgi:lipopolysaccharide export system protein LptA
MRNTQAARYARWSAMISMLLIVLVGAVYMRHSWQTRLLHMAMPPAVPSSILQQSAVFSFSKVTGNRTEFTIRASHATQFNQGGRAVLQDVWLTAYGRDGNRLDNLRTHVCEYFESYGRMTCAGEVEIDLESAQDAQAHAARPGKSDADPNVIHIVTSNISFDRNSGVATTPAPLQFHFAQIEGRAVGFRYDAGQGEARLLHDVALTSHRNAIASTSAPGNRGKAVLTSADELQVTGSALLFLRDARMLYLSGPVKAEQGSYELSAGQLNVELDERLRPRRGVANEHPEFHMSGTRPISISADEFSAPFAANGSLARIIAEGSVHARARGPADDNRLDAGRAEIELVADTSRPRLLTATGDVRVQSDSGAGVSRRLVTPKLEVTFLAGRNITDRSVQIGLITTAAATLDSEEPVAPSKPPAIRPSVSGSSVSSSSVPSASRLERIHLAAQRLDAIFGPFNELREIHGSGGVELERRERAQGQDSAAQTSAGRDIVAHFAADGLWSSVDETGDVHLHQGDAEAQADRSRFERLNDTATLSGNVIVTDGGWRTTSQFATFRQSSNEIRAEGRVATSQLGTSPPTISLGAGPAHLSGDRLVFDTASGHAIYSGHARLWQGTAVVEADIVELDRSTQALTATDHVRAIFPQAAWEPQQTPHPASQKAGPNPEAKSEFWRAEAGRMIYESSKGRARLEQTVRAHSTEGTLRADSMDLFFSAQDPSPPGPVGASSKAVLGPAGSPGGATGEKELSKAMALGHVLLDQESLHGTGDRADYTASEGKFVLSGGSPKVYDDLGNSTSGRQLTLFFADDKILVDSEVGLRTLTMHRVEK